MSLRTITVWVLYNPKRREIIASRKFKYEIEKLHRPTGCVVVMMKGHYVPPRYVKSESPNG